jgi:hypothetical protein
MGGKTNAGELWLLVAHANPPSGPPDVAFADRPRHIALLSSSTPPRGCFCPVLSGGKKVSEEKEDEPPIPLLTRRLRIPSVKRTLAASMGHLASRAFLKFAVRKSWRVANYDPHENPLHEGEEKRESKAKKHFLSSFLL